MRLLVVTAAIGGVTAYGPVPRADVASAGLRLDSPAALASVPLSGDRFAAYYHEGGELRGALVSSDGRRRFSLGLRMALPAARVAATSATVLVGAVDTRGHVIVATGKPGGRLRVRIAINLREPAKRVEILAVAVSRHGAAVVVYGVRHGPTLRVLATIASSSGVFSKQPLRLVPRSERITAVSTAVNDSGRSVVAIAEEIPNVRHDVLVRLIADQSVLPAQRFGRDHVDDTALATSIAADGQSVVAWHTQRGSDIVAPGGMVESITLGSRGEHGRVRRLDEFSLRGSGLPGVTPAASGLYHVGGARLLILERDRTPFLVWGVFDGQNYVVRTGALDGPVRTRTISPAGEDAQLAIASSSGGGAAVAAWSTGLRGQLVPRAASFSLGFALRPSHNAGFAAPVFATASPDPPRDVLSSASRDGRSVLLMWSAGTAFHMRVFS